MDTDERFPGEEIVRVGTLDYISLCRFSLWAFGEYWRRFREEYPDYHFFWGFLNDIRNQCLCPSFSDIFLVVSVAIFITYLRNVLTKFVFLVSNEYIQLQLYCYLHDVFSPGLCGWTPRRIGSRGFRRICGRCSSILSAGYILPTLCGSQDATTGSGIPCPFGKVIQ